MKNYTLSLPYDPFKHQQFFSHHCGHGTTPQCVYDAGYIFKSDLTGHMPQAVVKIQHDLVSVPEITPDIFDRLVHDLTPLMHITYRRYSKIFTLFILNWLYRSYKLDGNCMAYCNANRSFTDLVSLAIYYRIIKDEKDIINFFLVLLRMLDSNLLNVGYCCDIRHYVFMLRQYSRTSLVFGTHSEDEDILPFKDWAFVTASNLDIEIDKSGEPHDKDYEFDNDDDDYDDSYYNEEDEN